MHEQEENPCGLKDASVGPEGSIQCPYCKTNIFNKHRLVVAGSVGVCPRCDGVFNLTKRTIVSAHHLGTLSGIRKIICGT